MSATSDLSREHLGDGERVGVERGITVGMLGHDLRSSLAAVQGFVLTVRRRRDQMSSKQIDDALDAAIRRITRLSAFTEDLLSLVEEEGSNALRPRYE